MAVAVVNTGSEFHNESSVSSISGSVTIGSGANLLIVFANNDSTITCTGVTYNGVALTSVGFSSCSFYGNIKRVQMFVLVDPPTNTSYTLAATWSAARADLGITWQSFSGYGSLGTFYTNTSPTDGMSANPTLTIADWASGGYAVGSLLAANPVTANDTEMGHYFSLGNNDNYVSTEYQTTDGNLDWTCADGFWAACGCSIIPAATGVSANLTGITGSSALGVFSVPVTLSPTGVSSYTSSGNLLVLKNIIRNGGVGYSPIGVRGIGQGGVGTSSLTLGVSGISSTTSLGSVNSAISKVLTSDSSTTSFGSVSSATSKVLTSDSSTTSLGSVSSATYRVLTGDSSTTSLGSVNSATSIVLTNVSSNTSLGSVNSATSIVLTNVSSSTSLGSITQGISFILTGISYTASTGSFSASSAIYRLGGVIGASSIGMYPIGYGVEPPATSGNTYLSGITCTLSLGVLIPAVETTLSQNTFNAQVGEIVSGLLFEIAPSSAAFSLANVASSFSQGISGSSITNSISNVGVSSEYILAASSISSEVGNYSSGISAYLTPISGEVTTSFIGTDLTLVRNISNATAGLLEGNISVVMTGITSIISAATFLQGAIENLSGVSTSVSVSSLYNNTSVGVTYNISNTTAGALGVDYTVSISPTVNTIVLADLSNVSSSIGLTGIPILLSANRLLTGEESVSPIQSTTTTGMLSPLIDMNLSSRTINTSNGSMFKWITGRNMTGVSTTISMVNRKMSIIVDTKNKIY